MENLNDLKTGSGIVVKEDRKSVAVYKNEHGAVVKLSAKCKHAGCAVRWNEKEKTWDCPCHGSRYKTDGTVFKGPAKENLDKIS